MDTVEICQKIRTHHEAIYRKQRDTLRFLYSSELADFSSSALRRTQQEISKELINTN